MDSDNFLEILFYCLEGVLSPRVCHLIKHGCCTLFKCSPDHGIVPQSYNVNIILLLDWRRHEFDHLLLLSQIVVIAIFFFFY